MDLLSLVARVGTVFVLLGVVLWLLRRYDVGGRRRTPAMQVVSTTRLGKAAALSVVRVHGTEYVLGVTSSGVTVVDRRPGSTPTDAATEPGSGSAAGPGTATAPSFAALLDAGLEARTTGAALSAAPQAVTPPTAAEFLRSAWGVVRRRPLAETDLTSGAIAHALASVTGLPVPRAALDGAAPAVPATDGPVAPDPAPADRPERPRTDAPPAEEQLPWSRAPRPTVRDVATGSAVA